MDTKMTFTLKDLITLVGIISIGFGGYYTIDGRLSDLERDYTIVVSDINDLESANKAYMSLPKDVETLKIDVKDNAKLTKAIYLGLVAKGIIKPPQ